MSLFDRPKNTISLHVRGLAGIRTGERPLRFYSFGPASDLWDAARIQRYLRDEYERDIDGKPDDFAYYQRRRKLFPPAFLSEPTQIEGVRIYSDPEYHEVFLGFCYSFMSLADTTWAVDDNFILATMGCEHFIDPFDLFLGYAEPLEQP